MKGDEKMSKIKGTTVKTGLVVATLLCVLLFVLGLVGIHDGWPAFLIPLFFFLGGAKKENLRSIFSGGTVGLLFAYGLFVAVEILAPFMGLQPSIFLMVFLCIFLLIVLGDISHTYFNNYAFCYFTVALIYPEQHTLTWLFVLFAGGLPLIVAVRYFLKIIYTPKSTNVETA